MSSIFAHYSNIYNFTSFQYVYACSLLINILPLFNIGQKDGVLKKTLVMKRCIVRMKRTDSDQQTPVWLLSIPEGF